jgi:transcriptional regulator with XRE-family HTH domain
VANRPKLKCDLGASFAVAFGNWRRENKIPLKQVASDLGVSVNTVSLWEMGKRFPSKRHFERLVDYTGRPPCKLFCVMAEKCVPAECLLALSQIAATR